MEKLARKQKNQRENEKTGEKMEKLARKQKNQRENEKTGEKMRKLARKQKNWRENEKTSEKMKKLHVIVSQSLLLTPKAIFLTKNSVYDQQIKNYTCTETKPPITNNHFPQFCIAKVLRSKNNLLESFTDKGFETKRKFERG